MITDEEADIISQRNCIKQWAAKKLAKHMKKVQHYARIYHGEPCVAEVVIFPERDHNKPQSKLNGVDTNA